MEFILVFLVLFASKRHKLGFSHFAEEGSKEVFFYNPWIDAEIVIDGYPTGVYGSGFLNFPDSIDQIQLQVLRQGQIMHQQDYLLDSHFLMVFVPQVNKTPLKRVLP